MSAPTITAYAAVKALAVIFHEQIKLILLKFLKGHVIVCGMGNKGFLLAKGFYDQGYRVVVIEQNKDNPRIALFREHGAIIIVGNAADREMLKKARVREAKYLLAVCKEDGDNAQIAIYAQELINCLTKHPSSNIVTCLVHITNPELCNLLKEQEILAGKVDLFRMEFFNVFESGARELINEFPGFTELAEEAPHLMVVGLGSLGTSLIIRAALNWRLARGNHDKKLRITMIDKDAVQKKEYLDWQYRQLNDFWDLTPVPVEINSPEFLQGKFLSESHDFYFLSCVYVCLDNDSVALTAGLAVYQHLRERKIPIVVQMSHDAGLASLLRVGGAEKGSFENLHAFGLFDRTCTPDLLFRGHPRDSIQGYPSGLRS